ncbi:MAG: polyprenyl synthetase family protein, partial [Candidatus Aenigmarchaeota archaeon]|nr:polyprenyl synthetase family protein [Candidatus Aenigmarchaeota archaeon]
VDGDIMDLLKKLKPEIDKTIEKYLPKEATQEWLEFAFGKPRYEYNTEAVQKSLIDPAWDFLGRGGKRWRPVLFLLVAEAVGGDLEKLKDFVIIPEIIHNGTIMIDDVEDMGELRRGKPCTHKIFGNDIAINTGNFMYYLPMLALIKNKEQFEPEVVTKAYEVCTREMIALGFGQGTDIYWHKGKVEHVKEEEYLQMCAYKTGCLARMSAKLGVVLSGGSDELAEKVGRVAEAMGVAFQIQDDVLDIALTGEERDKFGKAFGNDIKEGKRTLMVIHALEKAGEEDRKRLLEILNKHTDDLEERKEAIDIIRKYGGLDYAKDKAKSIVGEAWKEAEPLLKESRAKELLKEFVYYLVERKV